jgi:hypothetical protein
VKGGAYIFYIPHDELEVRLLGDSDEAVARPREREGADFELRDG